MVDGFIQVAVDGGGKKVGAQEFTRTDGAIVEVQQTIDTDPATGRPLVTPPWAMFLALQRAVLVELRVLTTLLADETRSPDRQVDGLRADIEEQLK